MKLQFLSFMAMETKTKKKTEREKLKSFFFTSSQFDTILNGMNEEKKMYLKAHR